MSYHKRYSRRTPMGDIGGTLSTALDVASDPYMPEIVCRIQQLKQIGRHEPPQICTDTPPTVISSVGIQGAMPALRAYVYAQQNPWVYPAAVVALIGLPFWLGYEFGRGK